MVILYPEQVKGTRRRKNTWLRFCTSCARGCRLTAFCCLQFFRRSGKILEVTVTITLFPSCHYDQSEQNFSCRYYFSDQISDRRWLRRKCDQWSGRLRNIAGMGHDPRHQTRDSYKGTSAQRATSRPWCGSPRPEIWQHCKRLNFCTVLNLNAKTPIQMKTKAEFAQPYHKLWLVIRKDESITIRCNINNRENFPENSLSHHSFRKIHVELMLNEINKYSKSAWIWCL